MKCDLHIHTNLSDGLNSVDEVINRAINNNVNIISITDHNRIDTYKTLIKPNNINIINGVEISVRYNKYEYHFLMYGFDINNKYILQYNDRSIEYSKNNYDNYCITLEELFTLEHNTNSIVSLAHPTKYFNNIKDIEDFIIFLKDTYNLRAVECFNTTATIDKQDELIELCNKHNLYITGGSDYHGKLLRDIGLANRNILDTYLTILDYFKINRWIE